MSKEKKIDHKKAIHFIAEYISYEMQSKDRFGEIKWLLKQVYQGADIEHIIDDWDLDDKEQWRDDIDIYEDVRVEVAYKTSVNKLKRSIK